MGLRLWELDVMCSVLRYTTILFQCRWMQAIGVSMRVGFLKIVIRVSIMLFCWWELWIKIGRLRILGGRPGEKQGTSDWLPETLVDCASGLEHIQNDLLKVNTSGLYYFNHTFKKKELLLIRLMLCTYKSEVFSNCGKSINHSVLLEGIAGGNWKIKNFWMRRICYFRSY